MKIGIISDTHLTARVRQIRDNLDAALASDELRGCDLLVHLGDVTADAPSNPGDLDFARDCLALAHVPMRFVPGNHDVGEPPSSPNAKAGAEVTVAAPMLDAFRGALGEDRWCLDALGWRLIGLDAQIIGAPGLEDAQADWLDDALGAHAGPLGLFLHKPLFRDTPDQLEPHGRYLPPEGTTRLLARLARHDLRFVASGHTHQARQITVAGVDHIWVPALGFVFPDTIQESIGRKLVGVAILELTPTAHRVAIVTPAGVPQTQLRDLPDLYPALLARA